MREAVTGLDLRFRLCDKAAMAVCGNINILVNSAGIAALAPAEELSYVHWERTIAVNLTGTFVVAQAVGKYMIDAGWGRTSTSPSRPAAWHSTSTWPTAHRSSE
jgi:NAD(P)-dependent dehydrogenase (short-subunit alcohol dehydrogenase family)